VLCVLLLSSAGADCYAVR
jgi:hypothetical protein